MKIVDNRTTRKDNNKNKTTNIIYDQNLMSIIKENHNKIKVASDRNQRKQFDLYFNRKVMGPVPKAIGQQVDKKAIRCEVQKFFSFFENN